MKHNNRYYRYSLCLFLVAGFFLIAWLINNWQSNKVNASFKPQSTMPNGIKIKAIQDIEVGERSVGKNPQLTDKERSEFFADPDPATWRKLTLTMTKSNGKRLDITLLRPLSWIEEVKAEQGGTIYLDLPEMGAVSDAKVITIDPCPPIKPGKGNVITGTFHHEAGQTIDIHVQGLDKPIGCTANHPFWSETRQDFVEAGTLQPQEDLLLYDGQITKVIQILPRPGPERVHNLEVLNEHVYYVENIGVLVHNKCERYYKPNGKLRRYDGPKPTYTVNAAHVLGPNYVKGKTPLPADAQKVFSKAVPNDPDKPTAWFARNENGEIYRYGVDHNGTAHFNGIHSKGDGTRNISSYVFLRLGVQE